MNYDAIVIGSGFGGAVTACRQAERGNKVLVLEKGRRWSAKNYPSNTHDDWIWSDAHPRTKNGWIQLHLFDSMAVAGGVGVGGGSLVYANVSVKPLRSSFDQGWPKEISYSELDPYLDSVGRMLNVSEVPDGQEPPRTKIVREAAQKLGYGDRFQKLPLAVEFDPDYHRQPNEEVDYSRSKTFTNAHGVQQGTCVHCGNCDIGCPTEARNTLPMNYIPRAEAHGAEVRPHCLVRFIEPCQGGYEVAYELLSSSSRKLHRVRARRVFLGCGSIGSTELLLRCRDQYKTLKNISNRLGHAWSSNGDFLTPAVHEARTVAPTFGPTITCAVDFLSRPLQDEAFWIEDGGIPPVLRDFIRKRGQEGPSLWKLLLNSINDSVQTHIDHVMPWFAQGVDASDGRLHLRRPWYRPCKRALSMDWSPTRSAAVINAISAMHQRMAAATDGVALPIPSWQHLKWLITPHPLGGCNMGDDASTGVTNHLGEVFGYPGLHVVDGAIIPFAIGLNPSRTIAALAERISHHVQ